MFGQEQSFFAQRSHPVVIGSQFCLFVNVCIYVNILGQLDHGIQFLKGLAMFLKNLGTRCVFDRKHALYSLNNSHKICLEIEI